MDLLSGLLGFFPERPALNPESGPEIGRSSRFERGSRLGRIAWIRCRATLLWLLIPGPFALRRFLRVRRGLCPKCAYPMGESSVCTECGCGLPKRARTT